MSKPKMPTSVKKLEAAVRYNDIAQFQSSSFRAEGQLKMKDALNHQSLMDTFEYIKLLEKSP